jgi:hypothetical protein
MNGTRFAPIEAAGVIAAGTAGIGIVFSILFLAVGMGWAAVGAGAFTGFLCTLLVMMLPFTGIASTVVSATALAAYAGMAGLFGASHPGWVSMSVALSGILVLPVISWISVAVEGHFRRA